MTQEIYNKNMKYAPEQQRGDSLVERKRISAGVISQFPSGLARQLHDLAGYPELDEDEFDFTFWNRKLNPAFSEKELMTIDGWRMIFDNLEIELTENLPPPLDNVCDHALYCHFGIKRYGKDPFPKIPRNVNNFGPAMEAGFRQVLGMPLKRMRLPLACLWTNAALCHRRCNTQETQGVQRGNSQCARFSVRRKHPC